MILRAVTPLFNQFKTLVMNSAYVPGADYHDNVYTNKHIYDAGSRLMQDTQIYNALEYPLSVNIINGRAIANELTGADLFGVLQRNYGVLLPSFQDYDEMMSYYNESKFPQGTPVTVNYRDDYQITGSYACNLTGLYQNNGKGWIHPTYGKNGSRLADTSAENIVYQKNRLIWFQLEANTEYICKYFYPICREGTTTTNSLFGGVSSISTRNLTVSYGGTQNTYCVHGYSTTERAVPTADAGKCASMTLSSISTSTTTTNRLSDLDYTGNIWTDTTHFSEIKYHHAHSGYSPSSLTNAVTPSISGFTTRNFSGTCWIYFNTACFSSDGIEYSPVPVIEKR